MSTETRTKVAYRVAVAVGLALMVWGLVLVVFTRESAQAWSLAGVGAATFGSAAVGSRKRS